MSNMKRGVNNPALPGCVVCSTVYDVFQSPEFVLHTGSGRLSIISFLFDNKTMHPGLIIPGYRGRSAVMTFYDNSVISLMYNSKTKTVRK